MVAFFVGQNGPDSLDELSEAISAKAGLYGLSDVLASKDKKDTKVVGRLAYAFFVFLTLLTRASAGRDRVAFPNAFEELMLIPLR